MPAPIVTVLLALAFLIQTADPSLSIVLGTIAVLMECAFFYAAGQR